MTAAQTAAPSQVYLFDRCGNPKRFLKDEEIISEFLRNVRKVYELIPDLSNLESFLPERLQALISIVLEAYYSSKLAYLRVKSIDVSAISAYFYDLFNTFESILLKLSSNPERDCCITFSLILGLFISSLADFIGEREKEYSDEGVVLLISYASHAQILEAFINISPPAYKSRLFVLAQHTDLNRLEDRLRRDSSDQISKFRQVKDFLISKYGENYLSSYSEEVLLAFSKDFLPQCPERLWKRAVDSKSNVQTYLGASFIVELIRLQWGIIKDSNCIVVDPSIGTLYFGIDPSNIFLFLNDQAQQLFILIMSLQALISNDPGFRPNFTADADTLKRLYLELLEHLQKIVTALQKSYKVESQDGKQITNLPKRLQQTKLHVLLFCLCFCALKSTMDSNLKVNALPFLDHEVESFFEEVDYNVNFDKKTVTMEFSQQFITFRTQMIHKFPFLINLSPCIRRILDGTELKKQMAITQPYNYVTTIIFVLAWFVLIPILFSFILEELRINNL